MNHPTTSVNHIRRCLSADRQSYTQGYEAILIISDIAYVITLSEKDGEKLRVKARIQYCEHPEKLTVQEVL